jgi:hypothetical protein
MPQKLDYRPVPPPLARPGFSMRRVLKGVAIAIGLVMLCVLGYILIEWLQRGPLKVNL